MLLEGSKFPGLSSVTYQHYWLVTFCDPILSLLFFFLLQRQESQIHTCLVTLEIISKTQFLTKKQKKSTAGRGGYVGKRFCSLIKNKNKNKPTNKTQTQTRHGCSFYPSFLFLNFNGNIWWLRLSNYSVTLKTKSHRRKAEPKTRSWGLLGSLSSVSRGWVLDPLLTLCYVRKRSLHYLCCCYSGFLTEGKRRHQCHRNTRSLVGLWTIAWFLEQG